MIKRIKRMWTLSNKNSEVLNNLTDEQINAIPEQGNGKAIFISEGSDEDFKEQERADKGLKNIFGIGK